MAFDHGVLFDRTKPPGQKIQGEALDEFIYWLSQNKPIQGKSVTRAVFADSILTIFAYDFSVGAEVVISTIPFTNVVSSILEQTAPGSRLYRIAVSNLS